MIGLSYKILETKRKFKAIETKNDLQINKQVFYFWVGSKNFILDLERFKMLRSVIKICFYLQNNKLIKVYP